MWLLIIVAVFSFILGGFVTPTVGVYMFMHSPRLQSQMIQGMTKIMMGKGKQ